jgi:nucleoside 2-deoxyribosyltransferase
VGDVVDVVHSQGYVSYSPSRDGVMLAPDDPPEKRDEVFFSNVNAIAGSDIMIAILDVKDTGTIWELGMATGKQIPIIAVTLLQDRMNVMLERGVTAHVKNLHDLSVVLKIMLPHMQYGLKATQAEHRSWYSTQQFLKETYSYTGQTQ